MNKSTNPERAFRDNETLREASARAPVTRNHSSGLEQYHDALLSGKTTCEDLTRDELSKIGEYNRGLNAFITVFSGDHGLALSRARELDRRLDGGGAKRVPAMFGVPLAIKDNIFFAGFPTTNGCVCFRDFAPGANAEVVDRLLGAGCVPLGKTNLQEMALGVTATGAYGGPIGNPRDPSRIAGGSSGGSAASVALATGPLVSLGSDTGGSVRIPAALCGVCGFKPSQGLLNTSGVFPLSPSLDHVGLFTKTVPEMSSAFEALTGERSARLGRHRLGLPTGYFTEGMDRTVYRDFWRAVDTIRGSDEFEVKDVPGEKSHDRYSRARSVIMLREAAWFYEELLLDEKKRAAMHQDVLTLMDRGLRTGNIEYMHSLGVRADAIRKVPRLLDGVEALIMPTCPIVAPKVEEVIGKETGLIRSLLLRNTELFNISGLPALSLPIRNTGTKMPTALQIVGRHGQDDLVLSIAEGIWGSLHTRDDNR